MRPLHSIQLISVHKQSALDSDKTPPDLKWHMAGSATDWCISYLWLNLKLWKKSENSSTGAQPTARPRPAAHMVQGDGPSGAVLQQNSALWLRVINTATMIKSARQETTASDSSRGWNLLWHVVGYSERLWQREKLICSVVLLSSWSRGLLPR